MTLQHSGEVDSGCTRWQDLHRRASGRVGVPHDVTIPAAAPIIGAAAVAWKEEVALTAGERQFLDRMAGA